MFRVRSNIRTGVQAAEKTRFDLPFKLITSLMVDG